jgi:hypothetical protein
MDFVVADFYDPVGELLYFSHLLQKKKKILENFILSCSENFFICKVAGFFILTHKNLTHWKKKFVKSFTFNVWNDSNFILDV